MIGNARINLFFGFFAANLAEFSFHDFTFVFFEVDFQVNSVWEYLVDHAFFLFSCKFEFDAVAGFHNCLY